MEGASPWACVACEYHRMAVISCAYSAFATGADTTVTTCSHDSVAADGDDTTGSPVSKCTDSRRGIAASACSSDGASVDGDGFICATNASANTRAFSVSNGCNIASVDCNDTGTTTAAFVYATTDTCVIGATSGICI